MTGTGVAKQPQLLPNFIFGGSKYVMCPPLRTPAHQERLWKGLRNDELQVVSDSELMVKQMQGVYRVKNEALRELSLEASRLAREVGSVTYRAVRREHNELADRLVNEALDRAESAQ